MNQDFRAKLGTRQSRTRDLYLDDDDDDDDDDDNNNNYKPNWTTRGSVTN